MLIESKFQEIVFVKEIDPIQVVSRHVARSQQFFIFVAASWWEGNPLVMRGYGTVILVVIEVHQSAQILR